MSSNELRICQKLTGKQWEQFRDLIDTEGWVADDHSVLKMTPLFESTRVQAATDKDDNLIGAVVWNEYDELAWIGFYIVRREYRGKGVGTMLWNEALKRIGDMQCALRAVPEMVTNYVKSGFVVVGRNVYRYRLPAADLLTGLQSGCIGQKVILVDAVNPETTLYKALCEYDKKVTGRDRAVFLKRFLSFNEVYACALQNVEEEEIVGFAAVVPTGKPERHLYKIGPLYARDFNEALVLHRKLTEYVIKKDPEGAVAYGFLEGSAGKEELAPLLEEKFKCQPSFIGTTLFTKPFQGTDLADFSKCFLPHNNSCYFDA